MPCTPLSTCARPLWSRRPRWLGCVLAGLLVPALGLAQAIWDNNNGTGNSQWGTANNWNPNAVPGNTADIQFTGAEGTDTTVNDVQLRGNRTANSLTFNGANDTFSLVNGTGSRTLTLTSGDITRDAGSSGVQTLAFTTLALGGASAMNIAGSGSLVISSNITGSGIGLTKTGAGELILSGANTYSGGTTVSAGTLTVQSASAIAAGSTLTLAGGTLKINTASTTITTINLTANSTIDFSSTVNATLNLTTLNLNGFTLNVTNWTAAADHFYATNWTGATHDVMGSAPMNLVTLTGASASQTGWDSFDNQIRPNVPESRVYGAALLGALTALFAWRRLVRRSAGGAGIPPDF